MKGNKGFTIIELIAAIVIITMILLVAFPAVYKIIKDNKKTEYEYYYKVAKEAAYVYADTKKESLGGSLGSGCISDITIQDLIDYGFLKPFNKDDVSYNGNVVIRNNKGNLTVNVYLEIGNNKYGTNDTDTCLAYTPNPDSTLSSFLQASNTSNTLNGEIDDNKYIVGENPNNYVWYSGKLWRAIQIDPVSGQVKLITDDIISVIPFDDAKKGFKDSYALNWLNEYFLNSLYIPKNYIANHQWDTTVNEKVGLISANDLNAVTATNNTSYINNNQISWLITRSTTDSTTQKLIGPEKGVSEQIVTTAAGIKPTIYLNSRIKVVDGNGKKDNPYQLEGNQINTKENKLLNTRQSGEYVKIDDNLYRIINVEDNKTKIVSVNNITIEISEESEETNLTIEDVKKLNNLNYTLSNVYIYLNDIWYKNLSVQNKVALGDWCLENEPNIFNLDECSNTKSFKIGLVKYGEIFASYIGSDAQSFTTLTINASNDKLIGINTNGGIIGSGIGSNIGIKPSFYLDSNTKITSGSGTEEDPFVL